MPFLNDIAHHTNPRQFKFVPNAAINRAEMFVKDTMLDDNKWKGIGDDDGGQGWIAFDDSFPPVEEWQEKFPPNRRIEIDPLTNDIYKYAI